MWPKVSVSLIKKQFLFIQEKIHVSKSFWKIYKPLDSDQTYQPLQIFIEQFKKSSFIIQEQDSRTGHELLLKCSRIVWAQEHYMNVKWSIFKNNLWM